MAVIPRFLFSLLPLVFATVSIAFAIKAAISKDWAQRHIYDAQLTEKQWSQPKALQATMYRSPFTLCGQFPGNNTVADINTINIKCFTFDVYGRNKTSCEPLSVTNDSTDARTGDERLCQQIHWAGNLAIASSSFIGLGFLLTVTMTLVTSLFILVPAALGEDTDEQAEASHEHKAGTTVQHSAHQHREDRRKPRKHQRYLSPAAPYMNLVTVFSFAFGAILYLLAQFYGIVAFVQSASPNGSFAAYGENPPAGPNTYTEGPWIQGSALSTHISLAWFFAGLAAIAAAGVWRLPRRMRAVI